MNSYLLKSKTALITGCNRGIGKSILEKFAENGANCIACIRKPNPEFENFCNNLSKKNNVKINIVAFDLLNHNEIIGVIKKIFSITKEIDIILFLFNFSFKKRNPKKTLNMGKIK